MSETNLDDTTGLPALPVGQWWEVRKFKYQHFSLYGSPYAIDDGYEVCIVTKWVTPAHSLPKGFWWEPVRRVPEKVEDKALFRKQITDPAKFSAWRSHYADSFPTCVGKDIIEPADVLKTALDIMDDIAARDEAVERKEASDALIGAYPPKTLPKRTAK